MANGAPDRAGEFLLANARLVDRLLFDLHFRDGSTAAVVAAVRAYRNADGGLGHALEPDLRTSTSQPIFIEAGLHLLIEAGARDDDLIGGCIEFLAGVARDDGSVAYALASAMRDSRAEHWNGDYALQPSLHATAGVVGKLHALHVRHPWLDRATDYCLREIRNRPTYTPHTLLNVLELLRWLPDRAAADELWPNVSSWLLDPGQVALGLPITTYGLSPLRFAPTPDHPARARFEDDLIERHLDYLAEQQQADGGWPLLWDPPSPMSILEWRGRWTLGALMALRAYGRL